MIKYFVNKLILTLYIYFINLFTQSSLSSSEYSSGLVFSPNNAVVTCEEVGWLVVASQQGLLMDTIKLFTKNNLFELSLLVNEIYLRIIVLSR